MPPDRLNQTNFALKLDVTRQAVNVAIKSGKIVKHGTGRAAYIDLKCPLTKAYMKSRAAQRHTGKDTKDHGILMPPSPEDKEIPYAPPSPETIASAKAYMDKQEIERLNKLQATNKLELANRKTRNELIERDTLQGFMDKLYTIHNGQFKTLGLRQSSDVAAIFGIEDDTLIRKACAKIDRDVFNILRQIKNEMNKYLKSKGGKNVPDKTEVE